LSNQQSWHEAVLPPRWREAAAAIGSARAGRDFYLAGGTGAALQLGHRTSIDLDLFTTEPFRPQAIRDALRDAPEFAVQQIADETLHAEVASINVTFLSVDLFCRCRSGTHASHAGDGKLGTHQSVF
jgi:hypothetical protein